MPDELEIRAGDDAHDCIMVHVVARLRREMRMLKARGYMAVGAIGVLSVLGVPFLTAVSNQTTEAVKVAKATQAEFQVERLQALREFNGQMSKIRATIAEQGTVLAEIRGELRYIRPKD